jgi:hypothetical protein
MRRSNTSLTPGCFTDPKTRELLDSLGVKLIGYKQLATLAYKP